MKKFRRSLQDHTEKRSCACLALECLPCYSTNPRLISSRYAGLGWLRRFRFFAAEGRTILKQCLLDCNVASYFELAVP